MLSWAAAGTQMTLRHLGYCLMILSLTHTGMARKADPVVYMAGGSSRIDIHTLDLNRGTLEKRGAGSLRPTDDSGSFPYVARHPNRKFLYALDRLEPPHVVSLAIEDGDRGLRRISRTPVGPGSPPHLHVHPSGRWLLVVHYHPGAGYVSVLPLGPDGAAGDPVQTRKVGKKTHMVQIGPGGNHYFVPCTNSDFIAQFRFDAESGRLEPNEPPVAPTDQGAGPRHLAFHPNGRFAYAVNETNSTVHSWRYDTATGRLSARETVDSLPAGFDRSRNTGAHILVSPSGGFVYASNRGHDSIVIFRVDSETGRLERVGWERADGLIRIPRNFAIDSSGRLLLVANQDADSILIFRIGSDGRLTRIGDPVPTSEKPTFVGIFDRIE